MSTVVCAIVLLLLDSANLGISLGGYVLMNFF